MLLQTDENWGGAGAGLAADGDIHSVLLCPKAKMPGYVFYCIALGANLVEDPGSAAMAAFWEDSYLFCTSHPETNRNFVWQAATLGTNTIGIDQAAGTDFRTRTAYPDLKTMPARPFRPSSDTILNNALGGMQFICKTWDTTANGNMQLHIDARFLGFPQSVTRSAGFYVPRMYGPIH